MSTLVHLLRLRAADHPDRTAYCYLDDGEGNERRFSYRELEVRARAIAALLQERGIREGDRVLLLYPSGLDYIAAFFGCLFAGAVAVPAYAPRPKGPDGRLDAIAKDAQPTVALTTTDVLSVVRQQTAGDFHREVATWIATDDIDSNAADAWQMPNLDASTLAFLQYTSGSTSIPKGVMVSHGNLMANERMLQVALGQDQDSTWVGWLPMFHDMGLIGNVIQPLYVGAACVLMAPMTFVQEPIRWLRAITKYRGRTSGAPNFAYDLCVAKTTPEEREGLDLSTWSLAFNGAEPVRAETIDRFVRTFEPFGFRRSAFFPCYGLAEATLLVSGVRSAVPVVRTFESIGMEQRSAIPVAETDESGRTLVGCGHTWLDQTIVVADPDTLTRCADGRIGEIWISGPNVTQGYWRREEATAATFRASLADSGAGPFLRTGDLGFFHDGSLFISGRIKDLIIIRGRNHFPQDIELTVESSHPILRPGCGAAFSVDVDGDERLVVVQEIRRDFRDANLQEVADIIRGAVTANHELSVHAIVLIKPGRIPKTSSGKIQRHACRQSYLADTLDPILCSVMSGAVTAGASAAPEATLLRQTLTMLGAAASRAVMQSHLDRRVEEIASSAASAGAAFAEMNAAARSRLGRVLEGDLGMPVPDALVLEATSVEALAADLIDLVIGEGRQASTLQERI